MSESTEAPRRSQKKRRNNRGPKSAEYKGLPQTDDHEEVELSPEDQAAADAAGRMNLKELKEKRISELTRMARDMGI
jgi:hypothetical protein